MSQFLHQCDQLPISLEAASYFKKVVISLTDSVDTDNPLACSVLASKIQHTGLRVLSQEQKHRHAQTPLGNTIPPYIRMSVIKSIIEIGLTS